MIYSFQKCLDSQGVRPSEQRLRIHLRDCKVMDGQEAYLGLSLDLITAYLLSISSADYDRTLDPELWPTASTSPQAPSLECLVSPHVYEPSTAPALSAVPNGLFHIWYHRPFFSFTPQNLSRVLVRPGAWHGPM